MATTQPVPNAFTDNMAADDAIEMVSAAEIIGASRGILGGEAE